MLASFMVFLDTSVVNVSLPYIAGSLSASVDEATWALTSYLAANAVVIPISGWLANYVGRRRLMIWSIATFSVASLLCGVAPTLPTLVFFRVIQGLTGGVMMPLSQAIILESFPPGDRGKAMGFWSVGVVLAPISGPIVGGWLTMEYSWRWVFYINVPVGVLSILLISLHVFDPPYIRRRSERIDYLGMGLLVVGVGALQLLLDKGQEEDWFSSRLIQVCFVLALAGALLFLLRELTTPHPVVELRVFRNRTFATGALFSALLGFMLFGSLMLLPFMLQALLGYTPYAAGLAMAPRGIGSMIVMPFAGIATDRYGNRRLLVAGLVLGAASMFWMSRMSLDAGFWDVFWPQFVQGWAIGLLFIPLTTLTMASLPKEEMGNASSVFNMTRNLGSSMGIAIVSTYLTRSATRHRQLLANHFDLYDPASRATLERLGEAWTRHGADPVDAATRAKTSVAALIAEQAELLSFLDAFQMLGYLFVGMLPLVVLMRRRPGPSASRLG